MIGFAKIIGGMPSSVSGMVDHLLNKTLNLSPEESRLAAYYGRESTEDRAIMELARLVVDGDLTFSEAVGGAVSDYITQGGDLEQLDAVEDRIMNRLGDLAYRIQEGLEGAPLGIVRPDIHPIVAAGLGIEDGRLLNKDQINGLLAGRRTDGEKIEGKHYGSTRHLPANPKTGEERIAHQIGAYDFCPTPDKSVSVAWAFANPAERAKIFDAHIEAARASVASIATRVGHAKVYHGDEYERRPGHVGWLEFTHHTARKVMVGFRGDDVVGLRQDETLPGDPDVPTRIS